ncbi:MAG: DNA topoisomerase VI subunit B [Promethearchaeota archaeon]|nr:MAG: DNA topoisomerase VI subunit B [Candidatus Lokiarchaeota archaeon]
MSKITTKEEKGAIKQGTIAQFMRKRTQLVGFEFGYWKHVQYCAEFLDNALDAIETYQWKELKKEESKYKFTLDRELSLENLSIVKKDDEEIEEASKPLDNGAKNTLMQEFGLSPADREEPEGEEVAEIKEEEEIIVKDEVEVEEEVKRVMSSMEEIIKPVESIIDVEPIVIIRLKEYEPPSFLTAELGQKNVMAYQFEIFDNGAGMIKEDLKKYGKYLASSKSMELKQTRGSQGFGAPSAFSDAQNTTGRPIVAVSKNAKNIYATVMEFYTTSKNEKKYLVSPTELDCPFLHGTYIKLHYLNTKYVRGYADTYIQETALLNPHVTVIFIDPYDEQFIYPRKVSSFPQEPKYAKPHPSSTNIGDLQDLVAKSENLTISAFLQDSFVRVSSNVAKEILKIAKRDLQDKLNFLSLKKKRYTNLAQKKSEDIYFIRYEKRVYGRSKKKRDKLVAYLVDSDEMKKQYWEIVDEYKDLNKQIQKLLKRIKKLNNQIEKAETKKEQRAIEKDVRKLLKEREKLEKQKDKLRVELGKIFTDVDKGYNEQKDEKMLSDFEDLVNEININKTKPAEVSSEQFNSLFLAFKSVNYMSPPTDTAIPVGDTILENTMIKELGLKISENLDDFDTPIEELRTTENRLFARKQQKIAEEDPSVREKDLEQVEVSKDEIIELNSQILNTFDLDGDLIQGDALAKDIQKFTTFEPEESVDLYKEVFEYFVENFTREDDFVAAETRDPTSGKGLAYVVEAVLAYSKNIETPKRSRDVLSRFVNRTPKLRDSADCAITKAVQAVNWKNYNLESYDNGLPKGPIKILVNVSGPFVHLMFKSQSKNSLADDEELIKEIKYCLEAIGRRLRIYLNRRKAIRKSEKRASLIDKYIPQFVGSLYNIAARGGSQLAERYEKEDFANMMREAIGNKGKPAEKKEEKAERPKEETVKREETREEEEEEEELDKETLADMTVKELKELGEEKEIDIPSRARKAEIIETIVEEVKEEEKEVEEKEEIKEKVKEEPAKRPAEPKQRVMSKKTLGNYTVKELKDYAKDHKIELPSRARKADIIDTIYEASLQKPQKVIEKKTPTPKPVAPGTIAEKRKQLKAAKGEVKAEKKPKPKPKPVAPKKTTQTQLPVITTERIVDALSKDEWQPITSLIFKLKIKDMMDARFLQIKLKDLERKDKVLVDIKKGKKHWKLK